MKPVVITSNAPPPLLDSGEYETCKRCGKLFGYRYGEARAHRCRADIPWTKPWTPR